MKIVSNRFSVRIDCDDRDPLSRDQMVSLLARAGYTLVARQDRRSPSGNGWHVKLRLDPCPTSLEAVALQAILGSDPYREAYNLGRVRRIDRVCDWWRTRWNVLYRISGRVRR